jgi:hypothetical protein
MERKSDKVGGREKIFREVVEMGAEKFVNLTPHTITIIKENGEKVEIPSAGVARIKQTEEKIAEVNGITITKTSYGELEIPANLDLKGKLVIVSSLVAQASQKFLELGVKGVLVPNTGPTPLGAVRDADGRIVGVRSLILVAGSLD